MKAKKSLGQNFLINNDIIEQIVSLFDVNENDLIIEIGPGKGALTKHLSKLPSKLICVEIDTDLKDYLKDYDVIYTDILQINLKELIANYTYENLYIIGNLPYYITSPILEHIIDSKIYPTKMAFMVQKEVADRYSATPGHKDYGYMTLYLNYYYGVEEKIYVPRKNFNPVPKVDSEVIELSLNNKKYDINDNEYFKFLKECFKYKRKTLNNNLKNFNFKIDSNKRPEEFSQEEFIEIYKKYKSK